MNKSYLIAIVIALAAGGWVLGGVLGANSGTSNDAGLATSGATQTAETTDEKSSQIAKVRVKDSHAVSRIGKLNVRARTEAKRKLELRSELDGRIVEVLVESGQRVAKGDVLARFAVDSRKANLAESKALVRQRALEYEAAERLNKKGFRAETQVAANKAALDAARAMVKQMQVDMQKTVVRAPFDAFVEASHVEIGDYIKAAGPLFSLVDEDPFLIIGNVAERDVNYIQLGAEAHATLVTGEPVTGQIRFIAATADPATRTFRVEVEIPNPNFDLKDGMTAELWLPTAAVNAHFLSPAVLTLNDAGAVGVRIVTPENRVRFVPVQIIDDEADGIWLGGLDDHVRIIAVGQDFVRHGDLVEVVNMVQAQN